MKNHIKVFILSAILLILGGVLSTYIDLDLSVPMVEQAKAISYMVTLAGVVVLFSWYKRTATPVDEGVSDTPKENIAKQNRILVYLLAINAINAVMLSLSTEESIQMMAAISLLVVLISPIMFRTMQEKDTMPPKSSDAAPEETK